LDLEGKKQERKQKGKIIRSSLEPFSQPFTESQPKKMPVHLCKSELTQLLYHTKVSSKITGKIY